MWVYCWNIFRWFFDVCTVGICVHNGHESGAANCFIDTFIVFNIQHADSTNTYNIVDKNQFGLFARNYFEPMVRHIVGYQYVAFKLENKIELIFGLIEKCRGKLKDHTTGQFNKKLSAHIALDSFNKLQFIRHK